MARVVALIPDLLFGSKVQSALQAAGHEVTLVMDPPGVVAADVLVVDLTTDAIDGVSIVADLGARGALGGARTLGFFAHVQPEVRARALAAGFDQVVPRSRMAREGAALVDGLARG